MTVTAKYIDGSTRDMPEIHAKVLMQIGRVASYLPAGQAYLTRDMKAAPVIIPPAQVSVTAQPEASVVAELDSAGDTWNEAVHVSTKLKNADGTWRKRPGAKSALE